MESCPLNLNANYNTTQLSHSNENQIQVDLSISTTLDKGHLNWNNSPLIYVKPGISPGIGASSFLLNLSSS